MTSGELPHNYEAERAVLGSVLLDRDSLLFIANWLKPAHFMIDRHALIYEAMLDCYARRVPPDSVNVFDVCRRTGRICEPGDAAYLAELVNSVPTATHIEYYARIVEATGVRRNLIEAANRIVKLAFDETTELDTIAADAQTLLTDSMKRMNDSAVQHIGASAGRVLVKVRNGVPTGIQTGIRGLDEKLGGVHRGRLHVFAGAPGSGKTTLARQILYNLGKRGENCLFFSLEMTADEATECMAAMHAHVDSKRVAECRLTMDEVDRIDEAVGEIGMYPIFIDDTGNISAADIRLRALRHASEVGPLALIVVDYLQLIQPPRRSKDNPGLDIDANARAMKQIAKELQAPILLISQMTKEGQKRGDKPKLTDLLYGGDKDADSVAIGWRDDGDNLPPEKADITEWHVVKHRQGPIGVVPLKFDGALGRFYDIETYRSVPGY